MQTRVGQPGSVRDDADAHDHQIRFDPGAVGHRDGLDPVGAQHSLDADAETQFDAVLAMQGAHPGTHLGTQAANERGSSCLNHRDLATAGLRGCSDFGSDEASADYRNARSCRQPIANCSRVVQGAQRVHAIETFGSPQRPRGGARSNDEGVEGHLLGAVRAIRADRDRACVEVQPRCDGPQHDVGAELVVSAGGVEHQGVSVPARQSRSPWKAAGGRMADAARRR